MMDYRNLALVAALAVLPVPALAHHGVAGQFDTSHKIELSGTVTRIRLVNPHAYVYFDVTDDDGTVTNMRCELQSGSLLKRRGWSAEMFEKGSTISIIGSPDRTDPTTCFMSQITFENGVTATRQSSFDEAGNIEAEERQITREDGTPNLEGHWAMQRDERRPPRGDGSRPQLALTEAGTAAVAGATSEDNPRFHCEATNIVMDWWFDQMVNVIEQSETEITMTYGFMDLERTIHLDGDEPPADYVPSRAGFSVGEWQGDTLVVTTTGFDEGWIMAPLGGGPGDRRAFPAPRDAVGDRDGGAGGRPEGTPPAPPSPVKNSPELTVTERFTLSEDGTVLHREYQFVDPLYLEVPITGSDEVVLTSDAYEPYHCDDLTNERSQ